MPNEGISGELRRLHGFRKTGDDIQAERRAAAEEKKARVLDQLDEGRLAQELEALDRAAFLAPHQKERRAKVEAWLHALRKRRETAAVGSTNGLDSATGEAHNTVTRDPREAGQERKRSRADIEGSDDDEDGQGDQHNFLGELQRREFPLSESLSHDCNDVNASTAGFEVSARWAAVLQAAPESALRSSVAGSTASVAPNYSLAGSRPVAPSSFVPRHVLHMQALRRHRTEPSSAERCDDKAVEGEKDRRQRLAQESEARMLAAADAAMEDGETFDSFLSSFQ
jgi:hypothetical protein